MHYLLFGLMMADLKCGVVINKGSLQIIYAHPVNATLLAVQLDAVQVSHVGKDGQFHKALTQTQFHINKNAQ